MTRFRVWFKRLQGLFARRRRDRDLDDELVAHLRLHIDDNLRAGMTPEEARRDALLKLGGVAVARDRYRDQRGLPWLEDLARELRHALRRLGHSPVFTSAAVLSLALAIGANAAIFAVVYRVILNPLPYPDSDRLMELDHGAERLNLPSGLGMTQGLYYHYADRSRTLDGRRDLPDRRFDAHRRWRTGADSRGARHALARVRVADRASGGPLVHRG